MMHGLRSDLREVRRAAIWGYNRSRDPAQPTLAGLTGKAAVVGVLAGGATIASKKLFENPDSKIDVMPIVALGTMTLSKAGSLVEEIHDFANLMRFNRVER